MDKIFVDVYKKIIMQEEYNPDGINYSAIAAVMKGCTERHPGSPHPLDQQWLIPNSVNLDKIGIYDWNTYTKIVDDIRYDKYTLKDIFNNIEYFLKKKKGMKILKKYINDLDIPITDIYSLISVILDVMIKQGLDAFQSIKDFNYTKVYNYMQLTIQADMNMSIIQQTTLNIEDQLNKLGLMELING